jgi:hypothetical protein
MREEEYSILIPQPTSIATSQSPGRYLTFGSKMEHVRIKGKPLSNAGRGGATINHTAKRHLTFILLFRHKVYSTQQVILGYVCTKMEM